MSRTLLLWHPLAGGRWWHAILHELHYRITMHYARTFLNANSKINIHSNCEFCTLDSFNTLYRGFSMDGGLEGRIFKMVFSFYPFSVNFLHFSKFFHGTLCIYLSLCDWLTDGLCHGILRRNNEDTINSFTTLTNERENLQHLSLSLPPPAPFS